MTDTSQNDTTATMVSTPTLLAPSCHTLHTDDHSSRDTHSSSVVGVDPSTTTGDHHRVDPHSAPVAGGGGFDELRVFAECFEDTQKVRISLSNRIGGAERRHIRVPPDAIMPAMQAAELTEHQFKLAMVRCYRRVVPAEIRAWQESTLGVGDHSMARLLGVIGHPVWANPYHWEGDGADRVLIPDPPFRRTVSQLWSYCGHGDATRRKVKGMTAEEAFGLGSPRAKKLTWFIATTAIKSKNSHGGYGHPWVQIDTTEASSEPTPNADAPGGVTPFDGGQDGPDTHSRDAPVEPSSAVAKDPATPIMSAPLRNLRDVYEEGRVKYQARTEWTDGHRHNAAIRLVGKEMLRQLWLAGGGADA